MEFFASTNLLFPSNIGKKLDELYALDEIEVLFCLKKLCISDVFMERAVGLLKFKVNLTITVKMVCNKSNRAGQPFHILRFKFNFWPISTTTAKSIDLIGTRSITFMLDLS